MKSLRPLAGLAFALAGIVAVASETPAYPGYTYVRTLAGIEEYRLDANGLQVLVKPDHSAPVATYNITYRVGSRNEVTGTTGATHILEHMMFKGSEHFNDPAGNSVKQYLERVGGRYNATTWNDRTHYFATVGRDSLEGYIAIEADRMRNLWLRDADRQKEMTVVRNEYERGENDPLQTLEKEVTATAYQALPYHHDTIGWRSDIEHVPIEKLREFYDTFYWPDNATAVVIGDVDTGTALALVRKYYGAIPRAPKPIPQIYTEEPEQTGPRRTVVKRPGQLGAVVIAHKVPPARAADTPPLEVLDHILGSGKTSRLYLALVDKGLALSTSANDSDNRDTGLNTITATLAPGAKHEAAEQAILAVLEDIRANGVTPEEVAIAQRQFHTQFVSGRDGSAAVARELNEWIAAGDWTLYASFPESIKAVTPADVQRVAKQYLDQDLSTTGWFVPLAPKGPKAPQAK